MLSPAGRSALQAAAERNQPWRSSTGPRTQQGKARAKQNALRHGERAAGTVERRRIIRATLALVRHLAAEPGPAGIEAQAVADLLAAWDAGETPTAPPPARAIPRAAAENVRANAKIDPFTQSQFVRRFLDGWCDCAVQTAGLETDASLRRMQSVKNLTRFAHIRTERVTPGA